MENLILLWKVAFRKTTRLVEGLRSIRRIPQRQIGRVHRPASRQEFTKLTEVSRPARGVRALGVANRASDAVVSLVERRGEAPKPVTLGHAVGVDERKHGSASL